MSPNMKATIIMGSPRGGKGASSRIAVHFAEGLRRAGVQVEEVMLKDYTIKHCLGCYACWTKTPGTCVHRDDMDRLLPKMQADLLVFSTPLYTFSVPGLVKDFLDRQIPLFEPFLIDMNGITHHPRRDSSQPRDMFVMSVAGFPERSHFDGLVTMFKKFGDTYLGDILIGGSEPMSQDELQGAYSDLYTLIEQAGFEVGKTRKISQETSQAILDKTTYSPEKIEGFRKTANQYWKAMLPQNTSSENVEVKIAEGKELKVSDGGMASFMAGMALQYNPQAIPGFTSVIQFSFEHDTFHLLIKDGQCKAYEGEHPTPALTVITPKQVWLDISDAKLDGTKAFMEGLYAIEGDMGLLMKFDQLFVPEKSRNESSEANAGYGTDTSSKEKEIPEHRGPINLPAMTWLTIAFLPWMIQWVWGSITPAPFPRYAAAGVSLIITLYHGITNVVTLFEAGTTIYLLSTSVLLIFGWEFFILFGRVVDYLFLGGLWFGSVPKRFALTAEYSRYLFPKTIWHERAFRETNMIICAAWGGYFLIAALVNLIMISGFASRAAGDLITYSLLIPMFIFTRQFQKWYPEKLMRSQYDR